MNPNEIKRGRYSKTIIHLFFNRQRRTMKSIPQLFLVVCLYAVIVRSEVVDKFSKCSQFFYKGVPPQLQRHFAQPPRNICQMYQNQYHYATLYSTCLRIPLFSAYTLPDPCQRTTQPNRRATWFIEPEVRHS